MLLYQKDGIRVLQHEYLQHFYVQVWMECDNPRSYGRHTDFCTVLHTSSIDDVRSKVRDLILEKGGSLPN